jgi:hypothetical protein
MKTMIVCAGQGLVCVATTLAVNAGLIVLTATQLFTLTGAMLLIVGGVAGLVDVWQNRGMRFRRTRKGRRG